jgi:SAM-dependent methyltransferase
VVASPPPSAASFDEWYAHMVAASARDEITQRHLGLPPDLLSTGLLGWDGIAEVAGALRIGAGAVLLDLACGRGGYGLEIARRARARLVGVDFSAEAIRQAEGNAATYAVRDERWGVTARFHVGTVDDTGLDDASVDAVMCVDSIQFADPASAAFAEMARVLRPGGRVALTGWQPVDRTDQRFPDRLRSLDLRAGLTKAGFVEVVVEERPGWRERELTMWRTVAALDPGDDTALRSFHEEGVRILALGPTHRVIAAATRP